MWKRRIPFQNLWQWRGREPTDAALYHHGRDIITMGLEMAVGSCTEGYTTVAQSSLAVRVGAKSPPYSKQCGARVDWLVPEKRSVSRLF